MAQEEPLSPEEEDPKGVRHTSGVISDWPAELSVQDAGKSYFFIPNSEDMANSLSSEEMQQIMLETAQGIYLSDEVPF